MYKVIEEAKDGEVGRMKIGEFARVCNVTKDTSPIMSISGC